MSIASIANVQLSVLQLPEVAREQVPLLYQEQLTNAQVAAVVQHYDEEAGRTVQVLPQVDRRPVPTATDGSTARQAPGYGRQARSGKQRFEGRLRMLAAAHPSGMGLYVDMRA